MDNRPGVVCSRWSSDGFRAVVLKKKESKDKKRPYQFMTGPCLFLDEDEVKLIFYPETISFGLPV